MSQVQEYAEQSTGSSLLDSIIRQTSLTPEDEGMMPPAWASALLLKKCSSPPTPVRKSVNWPWIT